MNEKRLHQAGSALTWRALQLAGTKLVSFVRLLILARLLVPEDFGLLATRHWYKEIPEVNVSK
jgi:hypothetical protein